jgi:hypothetical protein
MARGCNIIVNVPSSIPTADITVPSPASTILYLPMDVVCRSNTDTQSATEIPATTSIIIDNLSTTSSATDMTAPFVISSKRKSPASTITARSSNVSQSSTKY